MISVEDQKKINDFREAYRKIMNKDNDEKVNKVIDGIFYNVECNYRDYQPYVQYVSVEQEPYQYHILQPIDGKYSLLDFLINRAITNIDAIDFCGQNGYTHHKMLMINPSRYDMLKGEHSEEFIKKSKLKSILHESGHAIYNKDFVRDGYVHCSRKRNEENHPEAHISGFTEKMKEFYNILGSKYPNLINQRMFYEAPIEKEVQDKSRSTICDNLNYEEAFVEYFSTLYSGLYKDTTNYYPFSMGKETNGKTPAIFVPDYKNGYAHFAKFIFHLDNLVSKEAMFESKFMSTDRVFQEFGQKYSDIINGVWEAENLPPQPDSVSKIKYLFKSVCREFNEALTDEERKYLLRYHYILDRLFTHAYVQEIKNGNISREKMIKISRIASRLSPVTYDKNSNNYRATAVKEWYDNQCAVLEKSNNEQNIETDLEER